MSDREELIDQFIAADVATDEGMWKTCQIAFELFTQHGAYSRDTVSVLKAARNLDYDAIYNRRDAWEEFIKLYPDRIVPPLKASYFYRLHRLRKSAKISDESARDYLELAIKEGWSGNTFCNEIRQNHDEDGDKTFLKRVKRVYVSGWKIWEDSETYHMQDEVRLPLYTALKGLEAWIVQQESRI